MEGWTGTEVVRCPRQFHTGWPYYQLPQLPQFPGGSNVWSHVDWVSPTASNCPPHLGMDEVERREMSSLLVQGTGVTKSCC